MDEELTVGTTHRRRYGVALVAAVGAAAIALGVALALHDDPSHAPHGGPRPTNPKADALRAVNAAVASALAPPGSREVKQVIAGLDAPFETTFSSNLVRATRWLSAPGLLAQVVDYLKAHPPSGYRLTGWSSSTQPGTYPVQNGLQFDADHKPEIDYTLKPYRGATALRIDASTVWIPVRPRWSYLGPVTSVEVTVVRKNAQLHEGARTVSRKLGKAAAQPLATAIDALPEPPPFGPRSCPAELGGEKWSDRLVFQTPRGAFTVVQELVGCGGLSVTNPAGHTIELNGQIDSRVLKALGLPLTYGR